MKTFLVALTLVLFFVGGQMLLLRPSARERALAVLREAARSRGFTVHVLPCPAWLSGKAERMVACYTLSAPELSVERRITRGQTGRWETDSPLPSSVTDLPMSVVGLEIHPGRLDIYWREQEGMELLPVLQALPETFSKAHCSDL